MRIFTPTQARSAAEERRSTDAMRAQSLAMITQEILKSKEDAEKAFEFTMKEQSKVAEEWQTEQIEKKKIIQDEVEKLEERKKKALSPLAERKKELEFAEKALEIREMKLQALEDENEEESRLLMIRIDEYSYRGQSLDERETRIKRMEYGAEVQKKQIAEDAQRYGTQFSEFQKNVQDKEHDLVYRKSEIDALERLYLDNNALIKKREKEVQDEWIRINDMRARLQKEFDKLNV